MRRDAKLTGHTREELIGLHFSHATEPAILDQGLELFSRQVAGELDAYTTDSKFRHKDGGAGWVRVTSTAVRDADGGFLYAVRVVEDITERRHADRRQRLLIDELNHRVKNTLATVQSLAWQAARPGVPPRVAQERFQERLRPLPHTQPSKRDPLAGSFPQDDAGNRARALCNCSITRPARRT